MLTSIPGFIVIVLFGIEQFGLFDTQKHSWIGSDDTTYRPLVEGSKKYYQSYIYQFFLHTRQHLRC